MTLSPQTWRRDVMSLGNVCRYWQRIVITTPDFWTRIDGSYELPVVQAYLRRSGPSLLHISYDAETANPAYSDNPSDFIDEVAPHTRRWSSFAFSGIPSPNLLPVLSHTTRSNFEDLQEFKLKIKHSRIPLQNAVWIVPMSWFLRRVFLQDLRFTWGTRVQRGFHTLQLQSVIAPSISSVIRAVIGSPDLEVLIIVNLHVEELPEEDVDMAALMMNESPVFNNSLKTLHVTGAHQLLAEYLFCRVAAKSTVHVVSDDMPLTPFLIGATALEAPLPTTIGHLVERSSGVKICVREEPNEIRLFTFPKLGSSAGSGKQFEGIDVRLLVPPQSRSLTEAAEIVGRLVSAVSPQTPVHLLVEGRQMTAPPLPGLVLQSGVLASLPRLASLELAGNINALLAFRFLSIPQAYEWPCAHLKVVDLSKWEGDVRKALVGFVVTRWGGSGTSLPSPPKLDELILPIHGESVMHVVKQAAARCEVQGTSLPFSSNANALHSSSSSS